MKKKRNREKLDGVGQLLVDGNQKLKNSVKAGDKAGISAAEIMQETATQQSQKLNGELSELRSKQNHVESQKRKLLAKSLEKDVSPAKKPKK